MICDGDSRIVDGFEIAYRQLDFLLPLDRAIPNQNFISYNLPLCRRFSYRVWCFIFCCRTPYIARPPRMAMAACRGGKRVHEMDWSPAAQQRMRHRGDVSYLKSYNCTYLIC